MKYYDLNDGNKVPAIGFGTYKITEAADMDRAIEAALEAGFTYFDTAKFYNNEKILGKYLKESGKKRDDYQIATKVWPNSFDTDKCKKSIDDSLADLDSDYIDVLLIHWYGENFKEAWKVFDDYKEQGIVKSIGVCNFSISQMAELLETGVMPVLDQLESHLHLQDKDTVNFLKENNILHQPWSPIARGKEDLLGEEILSELADKYSRTPAQIVLKWHIERGSMPIVKSITPDRIRENIALFDFDLEEVDMHALASLDQKKRYSNDPEDKKWLDEARNMD